MKSKFYGTYFIENKSSGEKAEVLTGKNRPYYIIVFGKNDQIMGLLSKTKFVSYPGFENSYYLFVPEAHTPISKVIRSRKLGDFVIEQPATKLVINGAKAKRANENVEDFQFSVASNLDQFKMDDTYLTDITNYEVPLNYQLAAITKNTDNTDVNLKGFTHTFTLRTSNLQQDQDVFIRLRSKLPSWVTSSSTEDDSKPLDTIQQKQTFGLKYLLEGISQAYSDKYSNKEQFAISVHVSTNNAGSNVSSTKFPWWLVILVAGIAGLLLYLRNKKS